MPLKLLNLLPQFPKFPRIRGDEDERDEFNAVAQGVDGAVYVGGYLLTNAGGQDWLLAKYTPQYQGKVPMLR